MAEGGVSRSPVPRRGEAVGLDAKNTKIAK
jgi:hypothetical protein